MSSSRFATDAFNDLLKEFIGLTNQPMEKLTYKHEKYKNILEKSAKKSVIAFETITELWEED